MSGLAQSASKRLLRIVSKCTTEDDLIAVFSRFSADDDTVFIVTRTPKPVGFTARIKIALSGGEVMIDGDGEVVGSIPSGNEQRPGMLVRLTNLGGKSRAILDRMKKARVASRAVVEEATTPGTTLGALVAAADAMASRENAAGKKPLPGLPGAARTPKARGEDKTPLPEPMPMSDLLPALPKAAGGADAKAAPAKGGAEAEADAEAQPGTETRAPSSSYILPANPLGELTDGSIEGFIECALYEETARPDDDQAGGANGAGHEDVSGFAQTLLAVPAVSDADVAAAGKNGGPGAAGKGGAKGKGKDPALGKTLNIAALPKVKPRPRIVKPPANGAAKDRRPLPGLAPAPGDAAAPPAVASGSNITPAKSTSDEMVAVATAQGAATAAPSVILPTANDALPPWKQPHIIKIAGAAAGALLLLIVLVTMTCGDEPSSTSAAETSEKTAAVAGEVEKSDDLSAKVGEPAEGQSGTSPQAKESEVAGDTGQKAAARDEAAAGSLTEAAGEEPAAGDEAAGDETAGDEAAAGSEVTTESETSTKAAVTLPPGQCAVAFTSRPDAATVTVDGKRLGKTPLEKTLPCGRVNVVFERARRERETRRVTLEHGQRTEVKAALSRPLVQLWVLSMPPGATVWVRGDRVGKTPVKANVRAYQRSTIKVRKRGYQTWRKQIRPTGKKTLKVRLRKR